MTMKLISTITVGGGGAANIEFTSIPQTYTDLLVLLSIRGSGNNYNRDDIALILNGSTANQYLGRMLYAAEGGTGSTSATSGTVLDNMMRMPSDLATANTFGSTSIYISNYAGSTYKSINMDSVIENNSTSAYFLNVSAGLWSNTAAITSIKLSGVGDGTLIQYSTASLYGITKGSGGATVA